MISRVAIFFQRGILWGAAPEDKYAINHLCKLQPKSMISLGPYGLISCNCNPAFARHLIALDDEVVNDVEDADGGVDEVWYSCDLEMCFREILCLMRLED